MKFQEVIEANRALLARARELNVRAGREVFPIPSRQKLREAVESILGGARSIREIDNPNDLLLPKLDQSLVNEILAGCPDTITVLGMVVRVEYVYEYGGVRQDPRVKLPSILVSNRAWLGLPDEGVFLPNGRRVGVVFSPDGYSEVGGVDIPALKKEVREVLNRGLWERWRKPKLPAPIDAIAPIEEREYGRCVVTNAPLIAYGTVERSFGSWYSHWTRDHAEAVRVREGSCTQFAEVQKDERRAELRRRLVVIYRLHGSSVTDDLRDRMQRASYSHSFHTVSQLEEIIAEVEKFLKPKADTGKGQIDVTQFFRGAGRSK